MYYLGFLVRRLLQGALIVLLVAMLIFTLMRVVPGDPVRLMVGGMAPDSVVQQASERLGLNAPIPVQFGRYLIRLAHGDMGESFVRPVNGSAVGGSTYDDPSRAERAAVLDLVAQTLPMTLQLASVAFIFALLIGVPLGIAGGLHPGRWPDKLAFYAGSLFVSMPNFWLGIVLTIVLSVQLGWIPSIGYQGFVYTILPAIVLAVEMAPFIIRTLTVSMAQVMSEPFIDAGTVRGISRGQMIWRHAFRNASVPLLNVFGIQLSGLLGGVLIVEFIFDYPGLGLLTVNAVLQRDFPLIQGIAVITSSIFVLINIIVDLAAAAIDPRLETV
jgi:ABC-type dipeptide/oligopeptide/nickel transport system permease component